MNHRLWIVSLFIILFTFGSCTFSNQPSMAHPQSKNIPGTLAKSRQIIIISDLHMGEGKSTKTGQWYAIEDFRWPDQFGQFLKRIDKDGNGMTDLIVDGDLFELWQSEEIDCKRDRGKMFGCTEEESLARLQRVLRAHQRELMALGEFARKGDNRLIIIPGNHDVALLFPKVVNAALLAIDGGDRVYFASEGYWMTQDRLIYIEHGHQIGREVNKWDTWPSPFLKEKDKSYLERPWGEQFVQDYYNRFERQYQIIDNISSEAEGVRYAMAAEGPSGTIEEVGGFLKFYFFGLSWSQFKSSLGKQTKGGLPEWNVKAIRDQGPLFLVESLPTDHPLFPYIRHSGDDQKKKEQLRELFKQLTDEDIRTICNQRVTIVSTQKLKGQNPTITNCPQTKEGDLGAIAQALTRSDRKVRGEHLEKVVCPNIPGCNERPFKIFIFGHTHLALRPEPLLLRSDWEPTIINSGAWQRVVTPEQLSAITEQNKLSEKEVLHELLPENLPPCYSYILIEPYSDNPVPLLRYWVGEEGQVGQAQKQCSY